MLPRRYIVALATLSCSPLAAQTSPGSTDDASTGEVYLLSPFEVDVTSSHGYAATQSLAGTRINTNLEDIGSSISVVTEEFLQDTAATDNQTLLTYTTNTEVGGPLGNTANYSGTGVEWEVGRLVNTNANTRVRSLTSADNTRSFFGSNIPWDSYNVERVEIQRGPNSILFGLGSPAGIINATTKSAAYGNSGELELRYGSYDSKRASFSVNREILEDELAVRVDVLHNDQKFQQKPAYRQDDRIYSAVRYDPRFLQGSNVKTTIKANYENGNIKSNNPRSITPLDQITPWWDKMNQDVYDTQYVQYGGYFYNPSTNPDDPTDQDDTRYFRYDVGAINETFSGGTPNPNYQPWIEDPGMYGGIWMSYNPGESSPYAFQQPETNTVGGWGADGQIDNTIGGLPYVRRVGIVSTDKWGKRADAPYSNNGLWKGQTLSDPTVFDFYNNLVDGNTKYEWQDFDAFNASLSQTYFNGAAGFEVVYDYQDYQSGQYSMTGTGAISVDVNTTLLDGSPNPNLGKAYIQGGGSGSDNDVDRDSIRLTAYVNHDFTEGHSSLLTKFLGRHTLTGLLSRDTMDTESLSYQRYGTPDWFGKLVATQNDATKLDSNQRAITHTYYVSDSLMDRDSYHGLYLSRPAGQEVQSQVSYYWFDPTWNASGVDPSAYWTNPYNGQVLTQSENPANYEGWSTLAVPILSAENGDKRALTTGATLSSRVVSSYAAVWQGFLWDGAIVGMYGIRHDRVESKVASGYYGPQSGRIEWDHTDGDGNLSYSLGNKEATIHKANSPSWSVVMKLNRFLDDRLPIEVNPFYNRSENFQVTGTRNNMYGEPLPSPSGTTKEYGVMLADKEGRLSLRLTHYETTVKDATNTVGFATWFFFGNGNFIARNEDRADQFEYKLLVQGDPSSAGQYPSDGTDPVWQYTPREGQTQAEANAEMQAAVDAWRQYTNEPIVKRVLDVWGYNDFDVTQPTTVSNPVTNFVATEDQISKGWEAELVANPTRNWRLTFNVSKTKAIRNNIGGKELEEFVDLTNEYQNGPMGTLRQWGGGSISSTSLGSWNSNFYSSYALMKQMEGNSATDLRKWRFNLVSNYDFDKGWLNGVNVGGGYHWQDKIVIGYPPVLGDNGKLSFDLDNPYHGPSENGVDLWVGYSRQLTNDVNWRIQLNVRNVGKSDKIYPVSTQWDGTPAQWAISPSQVWTLTSTFDF